jgi:ferredoxin-NADP reductase
MPIYTVKLLTRKEVASNTLVCTFEKPAGFSFQAGQYAGFTHIQPSATDNRGNTRRFSLLSAPEAPYLEIATRMQSPSAFKRVLLNMAIGEEIKLAGPTGLFTLHADASQAAIFIAGGIGIAPFYSMLHAKAAHAHSITLFYGNQSLAEAAFLTELQTLASSRQNFRFIPTLNVAPATWSGETGYINAQMLEKYLTDFATPIFYICGSPVMVTTLQETLIEMGISEKHIRVEDFPGY